MPTHSPKTHHRPTGSGNVRGRLPHSKTAHRWRASRALVGVFVSLLGGFVAMGVSHHEGQMANANLDRLMKTAPWIVGTPIEHMSDWAGPNEDSIIPPTWRGTDRNLRWTQVGLVTHSPVAMGETNPWGGWFVGQPGQPVKLTVNAVQATTPLRRETTGGRANMTYTVPGTGFRPSSVQVRAESGAITVTQNPDGSATVEAPAVLGGQQALWAWGTTATTPQQSPWLTQIRVGAAPYAEVQRVHGLERTIDEQQSVHLLAGAVAMLLLVASLAMAIGV